MAPAATVRELAAHRQGQVLREEARRQGKGLMRTADLLALRGQGLAEPGPPAAEGGCRPLPVEAVDRVEEAVAPGLPVDRREAPGDRSAASAPPVEALPAVPRREAPYRAERYPEGAFREGEEEAVGSGRRSS